MDALTSVDLSAALAALVLGGIVLFRPKGTSVHKLMGRSWVALMSMVALSSFWLRGLNTDGSLSWIHILSAITLFSLGMAVVGIRRGNLKQHQGYTIGAYLGLVGAGIGTLFPGRMVYGFIRSLF